MLQVPYLFQGLFSGCSCSLPVALRFSELAKEALDALEPLNMAQKRMLRSTGQGAKRQRRACSNTPYLAKDVNVR